MVGCKGLALGGKGGTGRTRPDSAMVGGISKMKNIFQSGGMSSNHWEGFVCNFLEDAIFVIFNSLI